MCQQSTQSSVWSSLRQLKQGPLATLYRPRRLAPRMPPKPLQPVLAQYALLTLARRIQHKRRRGVHVWRWRLVRCTWCWRDEPSNGARVAYTAVAREMNPATGVNVLNNESQRDVHDTRRWRVSLAWRLSLSLQHKSWCRIPVWCWRGVFTTRMA